MKELQLFHWLFFSISRVFDLLRNEEQAQPSASESVSEVREVDEVLVENGMEGCSTEAESRKEVTNGEKTLAGESSKSQEDSIGVVKVIEPESTTVTVTETEPPINNNSDKLTSLLTWLHNDAPLSPERLANLQIERCDFDNALRVVQPSSKREGFATVPDVTWDDIGSLQNIRQELQMAILVSSRISHPFIVFISNHNFIFHFCETAANLKTKIFRLRSIDRNKKVVAHLCHSANNHMNIKIYELQPLQEVFVLTN